MECHICIHPFNYFFPKISLHILFVEYNLLTSHVLCNSTKVHIMAEQKVNFKKLS